jgi:hypothetical protein
VARAVPLSSRRSSRAVGDWIRSVRGGVLKCVLDSALYAAGGPPHRERTPDRSQSRATRGWQIFGDLSVRRTSGVSRSRILIRTGNSGPPTWPSRYIYRSSASFALGDASLAQHSVNPCLIANGYLNLVWDGSSAQGPCGTRLELIRFSRAPDNEPRLAGRGVKSQRVVYKPVRYSVPASTC